MTSRGSGESPRLIATDLDGTLLAADGSVSARTAVAWKRLGKLGIQSVLVTARPPRWVDPLHEIVGPDGLAICTNGAFIYDVRSGTVIEQDGMPRTTALDLAARIRERFPDVGLAAECADGFYREPLFPDPHDEHLPHMPRMPLHDLPAEAVIGKLLAARPGPIDPAFLVEVAAVVGADGEVAFSGVAALAEISAPGVTKGAALKRWCAERGIVAAEVWAFGDMPNDLPMLEWAGRAYAVANAHPDVHAAASHTCPSNDEDGVAQVLERLQPSET